MYLFQMLLQWKITIGEKSGLEMQQLGLLIGFDMKFTVTASVKF